MHFLHLEAYSVEVLNISIAYLLHLEACSIEVLDVSLVHLLLLEACRFEVLDVSRVHFLHLVRIRPHIACPGWGGAVCDGRLDDSGCPPPRMDLLVGPSMPCPITSQMRLPVASRL